MSTFNARVSEVTIEMDGLHITTVTRPEGNTEAAPNEARIGDFHMSLFTWEEWQEISLLIGKAIRQVTE
jgi:hypothetical protein